MDLISKKQFETQSEDKLDTYRQTAKNNHTHLLVPGSSCILPLIQKTKTSCKFNLKIKLYIPNRSLIVLLRSIRE